MKYTCPCCGYQTLSEPPPGTYEICPVCFWEDDGVQFADPDYEGGANRASLRQEQQLFLKREMNGSLQGAWVRLPRADEPKDPEWRPLPQPAAA